MTSEEAGAVLRKAAEIVRLFVVVVAAVPSAPQTKDVHYSGSALLCDTGTHRFLITARHVVTELRDAQAQGDDIILFGTSDTPAVIISPVAEFHAENDDIDIGTISLLARFDPKQIGKEFCAQRWDNVERARSGETILALGLPAGLRHTKPNEITNYLVPLCDDVASSSERHFVLASDQSRRAFFYADGLSVPKHWGGFSGAPVFVNRDGGLQFIGVVTEGGDGLDGVFFAAHADFVQRTGEVRVAWV